MENKETAMEKKETAMDYLENNVFWPIRWDELLKVLDEAKKIEKQQIKDAFISGENTIIMDAEEYYNETYLK